MRPIHAEVKLDKNKSTDKAYFDKMWSKFSRQFMNSGVIEEMRLKRCYYKPSMLRKVKKQIVRNKWKHLR